MTRARIGLALGAFVLGLTALSTIGYAQTGRLKGKVVDAENKPVEGAVITMESKELNRKISTKTDKRGEYTQFLAPGTYLVTASKGNLGETLRSQGQPRREGAELHAQGRRRRWRRGIGCGPQEGGGRVGRGQGPVQRGRGAQQRRQGTTRRSRSSTRCSPRPPSASSARPTSVRCTCGRRTTTRRKRRTRRPSR